ncbi:tetratricopeptide repeat protein [Shewanella sp. SR43-4]|uniref:Ancillary SecYEG translocon subunit n=2 Tax=Shewanella TaxID=22 RepID=A0ABV0FJK5_9GAMM|nr:MULTISPECIES: tetratricopeptide repeat protein [Shewanella]NCQ45579.1 tetratricopeptide repeat protein [Shewanella frigidimarina]MBB1318116.1 tetratricopeptide repeat protein [Shewanella sp. SR43-4]MBB1320227.1 tetratricopeptide repeat protein [Shewanella sp. SR43-8]MBB1389725.1 tetratricopeptide repeat protein [Shewanella sp. SG44-6]MBB1474676.1 tetratricopeptide repeat protein [Shewanella sp. SG41-3]
MEIYSTEEQQVDAIKQFWKDYGTSIVVGAVVGLGGLYGWNTYSDMKVTAAEKASESFQSIVTQSANPAALLVQAESFTSEHDQQGYQALLELMVAKSAVEAGDLAKAEASFTKVIAAEPGSGLGMVAMIRLARIQAEQNNLGMALATLEQVTDKAFASQREELKGDFLVRQGDLDKAKLAYQAAVDNGGAIASPALTMKLDNLNKA